MLCVIGVAATSAQMLNAATVMTQDETTGLYTMKASDSTVKEVLKYIEDHSDYVFMYGEGVEKQLAKKVDVQLDDKKMETVLAELCNQAGLDYKIQGRQVTISLRAKNNVAGTVTKTRGVVLDENGDPMVGATVRVKDGSAAVSTDLDGQFTIDAANGEKLIITYIGYDPAEVRVSGADMTVDMVPADNQLEEVVVIGYGAVKKKDLTGAVASVKGADLAAKKTTTLSNALQGSVSGLMVRRDNNAPGASAGSMHVRGVTTMGDSSPLIIVDGVQCDNIDYVNANDVESISVLKDAAAASIYGSKAAAGVILITTKRGDESSLSLSYNGEFGWELPTTQPTMVGVTRYLEMNNELLYNDNPAAGYFQLYTADQVKNWVRYNATDPDRYPITDWKGMMMKSSAPRMTHTVSLSGGNKAVRSQASFSYDDVDGLYEGRNFHRIMFRNNNDFTISKYLSASLDVNIRNAKSTSTIYSPFSDMRKMPAVYPAVWENGGYAEGKSGANPYALLREGGSSVSRSTQVGGKASITVKPIDGLSISGIVSPFINFTKQKAFRKAVNYVLMSDPNVFGGYMEGSGSSWATNKLSETRNDNWHITSQVIANYMKSFGKNDVTIMAGYENYIMSTESLTAARDQYELTKYPYLNVGPEDFKDNSGTGTRYTSNSFFGRLLYSYDDKYLFQANVRRDGSSRFAKNYRWGTFPSFSAGWVMTREKFMEGIGANSLSFLKLRGSWGKLGNERIGDSYFPYMSLMTFGNAYFYENGQVVSDKTAALRLLAVEDISWETTTSTDLGIDAYFLNSRLKFTADYYWKKTTDMLLAIQIPWSMGYSDPNTNAGKMSTHGYDLEVSWNDRHGDFYYGVTVNLSDFISKIDYLNNSDIISGGKVKRAGELFNAWYGYICDGIYQTQDEVNNSARLNNTVTVGDLKYRDISGPEGKPDGVISSEYDRVPLGNSLPRFQYGGTINLGWKGIDMSIAFQGIGKQNAYLDRAMVEPLRDNYGNIPAIIEGKYWSVFNTDAENRAATYPRLTNTTKGNNYAISDFWMFNGRYFRLKNVTLGYTLPTEWTKKACIQKARFYFSASDLFSIDNYPKGWDPEMGVSAYPITTSLIVGVNLKF
ncbi:MAG: TonB-dependent receptor [Muribaculaceae bacterium]|nr:TonB-dependent receptor [Muribaculaceae bacterium]